MKNTRKLFAGLTALCCTGSLMTAFPVSAEMPSEINLKNQTEGFYGIVTSAFANQQDFFIDGTWQGTAALPFTQVMLLDEAHLGQEYSILTTSKNAPDVYQSSDTVSYGDLVYFEYSGTFNDKNHLMNVTSDDAIYWCGSAADYLDTVSYTITEHLGGGVYQYENSETGETFTSGSVRINGISATLNDTVKYLTYENQPILPLEVTENPLKYSFTGNSFNGYYLVRESRENSLLVQQMVSDYDWTDYAAYWHLSDYEMKSRWSDLLQISDGLNGKLDGQEWPETGDMLHIKFNGEIVDIIPGCMHFYPDDSITNCGNIEEIGTLQDLTVTETSPLTLQDTDGNIYYYLDSMDIYHQETGQEYTGFHPQQGETVSFWMYNHEPVMPNLKTELIVNPVVTVSANGDADGSGKLDILDVIIVNRAILGKEDISPDRISDIDFNGNNKPDAEDALIMMKKIVGLL